MKRASLRLGRSGARLSRFEVAVPVMVGGDGVVVMRVCYWGRWADSSGGYGPFSRTCVAPVEGAPAPGNMCQVLPALPGAKHEQIRVTQVVGQIEGKVMFVGQRALPSDSAEEACQIPGVERNLLEAG